MNGARALIKTLYDNGVEVCFANPGTSEMQLVAAIDVEKKMKAVLGLFEGVVTGAADGYGRIFMTLPQRDTRNTPPPFFYIQKNTPKF